MHNLSPPRPAPDQESQPLPRMTVLPESGTGTSASEINCPPIEGGKLEGPARPLRSLGSRCHSDEPGRTRPFCTRRRHTLRPLSRESACATVRASQSARAPINGHLHKNWHRHHQPSWAVSCWSCIFNGTTALLAC
jgi:hypothetical protein